MAEFKRERRYIVIKIADLYKYAPDLFCELDTVLARIETGRKKEGKGDNNYVVVNEDEPYAETVWALIQARWEETEGIER